jgi:uncharacterized protein YecE (DUF72 family)
LERYAACFDGVEINSTFYRSHRASTYARWVASTPPHFRFAVKLPRAITHGARLAQAAPLVGAFRAEAVQLRDKLGPLLVQLPPSLVYQPSLADGFFQHLRDLWPEPVVCEPRHPSWFGADADGLMAAHRIGRVAADPPPDPAARSPGGWKGIRYWRLHGSPRMYRSSYDAAALAAQASAVLGDPAETWCMFDNTTTGAATANALDLQKMVASRTARRVET